MTWSRLLGATIGFAALAITSWPAAVLAAPADDRQPAHEQYFLDFRSRAGYVFCHTYIAYGRLGDHGQPLETRYAGIYPLDDERGLIFGSVMPVAASVRGLDDDRKAAPTNIYRRRISAAQYARFASAVRRVGTTEHLWHLIFYNCNDFAIEVAQSLRLRTPRMAAAAGIRWRTSGLERALNPAGSAARRIEHLALAAASGLAHNSRSAPGNFIPCTSPTPSV